MKHMTSTFKPNPLPMHRDFVSKQFMGTKINYHKKEKQVQLQKFQHIERKLDIIAICKSTCSSLIIIFSSIMNEFNNITITQSILFMIHKHGKLTTLHISKILLIRNSGNIIRDSNTINCFHIKRVMFRKRVLIIMKSFINIIITTFYSISFITIIIISSNFVLIIIN